jgi:hypothetical protein
VTIATCAWFFAAERTIDGHGQPVSTLQLVVVGEISGVGGEIAWQFRRSS